jgi:hypothetical protein
MYCTDSYSTGDFVGQCYKMQQNIQFFPFFNTKPLLKYLFHFINKFSRSCCRQFNVQCNVFIASLGLFTISVQRKQKNKFAFFVALCDPDTYACEDNAHIRRIGLSH